MTLTADLKPLTAACTALTVQNEGTAFTVTVGTALYYSRHCLTQDTVPCCNRLSANCSFTALNRNTEHFRLYPRLTDGSHTNGLSRLPKYHRTTIQACSRGAFETPVGYNRWVIRLVTTDIQTVEYRLKPTVLNGCSWSTSAKNTLLSHAMSQEPDWTGPSRLNYPEVERPANR